MHSAKIHSRCMDTLKVCYCRCMSEIQGKLWKCDVLTCGHVWYSPGEAPKRCAKCKSVYWNKTGAAREAQRVSMGPPPKDLRLARATKIKEVVEIDPMIAALELAASGVEDEPDIKPTPARSSACPSCHALNGMHQRGCKGK